MANIDPNRILFDGQPATITGWTHEDDLIVDLLLDSGRQTWCFWPSPRLSKLEEDSPHGRT